MNRSRDEQESEVSLHDCLLAFREDEEISDYQCGRCRSSDATASKRIELWKLPPILVREAALYWA